MATLFSEDFKKLTLGDQWLNVADTTVVKDEAGERGQYLRVKYAPTARGSARLEEKVAIAAGDHYKLSYDILFEEGFEFMRGGKLPGISPTAHTTGCVDPKPNGWSVRVMWRAEGSAQGYFYCQDPKERCGDGDCTAPGVFQIGKWQHIELEVKMNSAADAFDGFMKLFVDGKLATHHSGLRFRGEINDDTLINHFFFSTFYGGADPSWAPSKDTFISFDNFKIVDVAE